MAKRITASKYSVWILENGDVKLTKVYISSTATISELKDELKKKEKKYEGKQIQLYKGDRRLDDESTVRFCNITTNDKLLIRFEDGSGAARRQSLKKQSPYAAVPKPLKKTGNSIKRKKRLSLDETTTSNSKEKPKTLKKYYSSYEVKEQPGNGPSGKAISEDTIKGARQYQSAILLYIYSLDTTENIKPDQAITTEKDDKDDGLKLIDIAKTFPKLSRLIEWSPGRSLSSVMLHSLVRHDDDDNNRPRTAPEVFTTQRLFSTLQQRSTTTDDLVALETEILCDQQAQIITKNNSIVKESVSISDCLRLFLGDMVCACADSDGLSSRLLREGLISLTQHRDIVTTLGYTPTYKATQLICIVRSQMKISPNPISILQSFCRAIKDDPTLKLFIPKLEQNTGVPLARPRTPDRKRITSCSIKRCQQCQVNEDDIRSILCRTTDVARHWRFLGRVLGISREELQLIQTNYTDSHFNCYSEMIDCWVTSSQQRLMAPTWQTFTQHLIQQLDLSDLGAQLRQEFCKDCCSF